MVFFVMVLWRLPTLPGLTQVSSAVPGLTSLFGMGRGEHRANSHQQDLCECIINVILEAEERKNEFRYDALSCWVISTARLNAFLHVHLQPINVVVYNDPYVEDSSSG